jgi:hypothetical protein
VPTDMSVVNNHDSCMLLRARKQSHIMINKLLLN